MTNKFPALASNIGPKYRDNLTTEEWLHVLDSLAKSAMDAVDDDRFDDGG
jgi:hypothetical protein